jgi:hypothetical protein
MIQTKHVNNALVYYDDRYANRWLDAVGSNVVKWELGVGVPKDDTTNDPSGMVNTETGTNTILSSTIAGDRLTITTGGTEYNGDNLQAPGSAFKIESGKPLYFGARIAVQNGAGKGDYLIGLCEVDTTLLATASAHALAVTDDGVYFYMLQAGTSMIFVNELDGTEGKITAGALGSGAYHDVEFYYDGATLYAYFDGTLIGSVATGLAAVALTPSINVRAGDDSAEIMYVQWMKAIQVR